ncbi:MAG: hypothetical protein Q9217_000404 [Psora testacea]
MVLLFSSLKTLYIIPFLTFTSAEGFTDLLSSAVPVNLTNLRTIHSSYYEPPTDFSVNTEYSRRPIAVTDTLMNTVKVLADIAIEDSESLMPLRPYSAPGYNKVQIRYTALPGRATRFKRKYASWGFASAITFMVRDRKFVESVFSLYWKDAFVGAIRYVIYVVNTLDAGAETSKITATNGTTLPAKSVVKRDSNVTGGLTVEDVQLKLDMLFIEGSMTIFDAFLTMIHVIADETTDEADEIVQSLRYRDTQTNVVLTYGNIRVPERTMEPKFRYRYLFWGLAEIPREMLERRRFGNARFAISVNNVPVGDGTLDKLPSWRGGKASLGSVEPV